MKRIFLILVILLSSTPLCYCQKTTTTTIHEYVDLGLSVNWATCNVGAYKPEEYGDYYAWGETITKDYYHWIYYKFEAGNGSASDLLFNKYVSLSNYSNGVNGYMVTGKKPGYEDHSIFLPAAGCIWYDRNGTEGQCAYYSSSSLSTEEQETNWCLWFIDPDAPRFWKMAVSPDRLKRAVGQSVRPVSLFMP